MVLLDDKEVVMEDKPSHTIPNNEAPVEVARSLRDTPPGHYTFKIESFSLLSQILLDAKKESYETEVFKASGYNWKLSLYPNGDKQRNGEGHISLYLVIAETDNLPLGWEVNVNFKLFVFDQVQDKYMTIQYANGKVRRFHKMRTEWGFAQLLPVGVFNDPANGYLIRDTCVFGAEVFVINYSGNGECLSVLQTLGDTHTWKIKNFSCLKDKYLYSSVYTIGNRKWKLLLYPNGDSRQKGKCLSLFLCLADWATFPCKTYAKYHLQIMSQFHDKHVKISGTKCFTAQDGSWGYSSLCSLRDLRDASKGLLVNDTLIVEFKVDVLSAVKKF